jgi:pectate lyase
MMKKKLLFLAVLLISLCSWSQTVTIDEADGWMESAYVKWQPVAGADSYNVYYSGNGITNQKIDNPLIRSYGSYFRADILGISAGTYTISVAPVSSGVEGTATNTGNITVLPHDRTGFAFANGRVPGAYKADGTPKSGAVILYITDNTKNTISMNVTGANANPCVGLQTILDGFKKGNDTRPLIVRLIGQITDLSYMLNGDIVIENKNNASSYITLEGVGDDTVAYGWGIRVKNATNIEIRNIAGMLTDSDEGDNIGLQQNNDYVWVHNVDFFYGQAGSASDQAKGDGALDCKKSTYVTFSYNHFWDSGKSNLLGLSEGTTTGLYITYHHNWYDHSDSRHPRVRYYSAHIYNNYFDGNSKYGSGSTNGSSLFVENNYFRHCKYPMLTSMQGTDIFYGTGGTFSSEDGGTIKAFNNSISGETRFVAYDAVNYPVEFDAYVATTRGEVISSSITSKQGGNAYNNFDTDPALYIKNLVIETPEAAKDNVMLYSGRMKGGDFKWTFNDAIDDTSSDVNTALKNALSTYTTGLVYIQGEPVPSTQTLTVTTGNSSQDIIEGNTINTIVFTWGGDATDATVSGLPANGLTFVKDAGAKTVTITGTPTDDVYYTVSTVGAISTPISESGTITVLPVGSTTGDEIHNFTESGLNSTFYSFANSNLSTSKGTENYDGLTLTQCLKIESSTIISFNTTAPATLTLVFNIVNSTFNGRINIDNGTIYTAVNGIINNITLAAGSHTITKTDTANLYYMKLVYNTLGVDDFKTQELKLYPNPVSSNLHISSKVNVQKVEVYNMLGMLIKNVEGNTESIDMSSISNGSYLLKVFTNEGVVDKIIIKK